MSTLFHLCHKIKNLQTGGCTDKTFQSEWHLMIWRMALTSIPGKGVTSDPVAMRIFLAVTTSELPSLLNAVTSLGPVIVPCPCTCVTWWIV